MRHFIWRSINSLFCVFQFVSMGHCSTHRSLMVVGGKSVLCSLGVITKHPFYWFFWIIGWLIIDKEKGAWNQGQPWVRGWGQGHISGSLCFGQPRVFHRVKCTPEVPRSMKKASVIKHVSNPMDHIQFVCMSASILWYQCGYYPQRAETTDA